MPAGVGHEEDAAVGLEDGPRGSDVVIRHGGGDAAGDAERRVELSRRGEAGERVRHLELAGNACPADDEQLAVAEDEQRTGLVERVDAGAVGEVESRDAGGAESRVKRAVVAEHQDDDVGRGQAFGRRQPDIGRVVAEDSDAPVGE